MLVKVIKDELYLIYVNLFGQEFLIFWDKNWLKQATSNFSEFFLGKIKKKLKK